MMNIHYGVENEVSLSLLTPPQQALNILPKLAQLWASIADDGPTLNQHQGMSFKKCLLGHCRLHEQAQQTQDVESMLF